MDTDVRDIVTVAMTRVMHLQGVEPLQQVFLLKINAAVQIFNFFGKHIFLYGVVFGLRRKHIIITNIYCQQYYE